MSVVRAGSCAAGCTVRLVTRLLIGIAVLLAACAHVDDRPRIASGACLAAAEDVEMAWRELVGDVPAACVALERTVPLTLTYAALPCATTAATDGCYMPDGRILIDATLSERQLVELAVHEWTHALAHCVTGKTQADHAPASVWGEYPGKRDGEGSVLELAERTSALGPCL